MGFGVLGLGVLGSNLLSQLLYSPKQPPKTLSCWPTAVEVPTGNGLLESTTERSLSIDSNLQGLAAS